MRILFATGHGYLPQRVGGSESSTHELILSLEEEGNHCAVLAQLQGNDWLGLRGRVEMMLARSALLCDHLPGYAVHRARLPADQADAVVARERPSIVLVQAGAPLAMAGAFSATGLPTVVYLRDAEFHKLGGDPASMPEVSYIANSAFVSERFHDAFGLRPEIVPPLFHRERYATPRTPKYVTFINPHPLKGVDLAFEIAALCPEIPFLFLEGWPMSRKKRKALKARVAAHPNIHLQPRTHDMRQIYQSTHTLLVPSQWEEAWGRVATEAQFSGIPVLASNRGGLPQAVGPGGRVLAHDAPAALWAAALREYWCDQAAYTEASEAALAYARRPEIDPRTQVRVLTEILEARLPGRNRSA